MRIPSSCILFVGLGLAVVAASPVGKKLEKKSISESAAAGASEVDQRLDAPLLGDEALMESSPGAKVERTKKQASTTFCVEIRHNKPTAVDCDEVHRPQAPPAPPPYVPEPIPEIHVHPPPPPAPIVIPQPPPPPPPPPINIQVPVPCEPEMAAYVIQPPSEVVYAPTGNCAPTVIHGGSSGAGLQVYQLPSNHLHPTATHGVPTGTHGAHGGLTIHGQASVQPVHTHGSVPVHSHDTGPVHAQASIPQVQTQIQAQVPVQAQVQVPMPIQTQVQIPQAPVQVHTHSHAPAPVQPQVHSHAQLPVQGQLVHQFTPGIECSCQSAQAGLIFQRAQGAPAMNNEALALQFLRDIQRNSNNQQNPLTGAAVIMQPSPGVSASVQQRQMSPSGSGNPTLSISMPSMPMGSVSLPSVSMPAVSMPAVSAGSSVQMGGKSMFPSIQARAQAQAPTMPPATIRTMPSQRQQQQQQQQQQPGVSFQMKPLMNVGITRSPTESFDDGFPTTRPQLLRLSRGPGEMDSKDQPPNKGLIRPKEEGKKKSSGATEAKAPGDKPESKNSRIARYLAAEEHLSDTNNLIDN